MKNPLASPLWKTSVSTRCQPAEESLVDWDKIACYQRVATTMQFRKVPLLCLSSVLIVACGGGGSAGPGPTIQPTQPPVVSSCTTPPANISSPAFTQPTESLGLCYGIQEVIEAQNNHIMGGGLAMSDIDNDGFLDLYVVHGIHDKGRLYRFDGTSFTLAQDNNGITLRALDNAGYFIDINSDGWDDFISIQYPAGGQFSSVIEVFINDQAGRFVESTQSTGIYIRKPTYSMAAADYDLDGDIDLFFSHWGHAWRDPDEEITEYLWENDGTGFFVDVSNKVEILPTFRPPPIDDVLTEHSFTPIFADINSDRYPDILLAGDFESSQVLINNSGTSFTDATTDTISDENGMGAAVADYDNDGDLDWFVSSIYFRGREEDKQYIGGITGNRLYRNDGTGVFTDVTDEAGIRDGGWGWGACMEDFDNDGIVDIFHTNGMRSVSSRDGNETDPFFDFLDDESRLYIGDGVGSFIESAATLGVNHDDQGRGIVCTDFNSDGRIDIIVATNGKAPTVYANNFENSNHYLQIDLEGPPGNREAIGARISVETSFGTQIREVLLGANYLSQQPTTVHFGLGSDATVASVTVSWPGVAAMITSLEDVPADQRLTISSP